MGFEMSKAWLPERMQPVLFLLVPKVFPNFRHACLAAEWWPEKQFLNLIKNLPNKRRVKTVSGKEKKDGSAEIRVSVYVSREGHRGIVLGKGGQTLRRIGQSARLELEEALDRRIHLLTHVKYRKDWMDDKERYADWDLNFDA